MGWLLAARLHGKLVEKNRLKAVWNSDNRNQKQEWDLKILTLHFAGSVAWLVFGLFSTTIASKFFVKDTGQVSGRCLGFSPLKSWCCSEGLILRGDVFCEAQLYAGDSKNHQRGELTARDGGRVGVNDLQLGN